MGLHRHNMDRRKKEGILYIKENIQAYEIKSKREADSDETVWSNTVSGD